MDVTSIQSFISDVFIISGGGGVTLVVAGVPMCVLLVEDEEPLRSLLAEAMIDAGFEVIKASDAESALGLARAVLLPQIVVSDINLGPGMNGFALVTAARCWWPAVPVLLTSGVAANFAGRHHCTDERFLLKPFSLDTFMRNVTDLVAGS